ncbi:hypothetical protein PSAC2689_100011 [Paraburkholderia sacchari]
MSVLLTQITSPEPSGYLVVLCVSNTDTSSPLEAQHAMRVGQRAKVSALLTRLTSPAPWCNL